MLSDKHKKQIAAISVAVTALLLFWWWASAGYPTNEEICDLPPTDYDCQSYNIIIYFVWAALNKLNFYGAAITAGATVAIGIFTYTLRKSAITQGTLAQKSIDLARDDFNATHRPWLAITHIHFEDFHWDQWSNWFSSMTIWCKNTGNSPAVKIYPAAKMIPFIQNGEIAGELAKIKKVMKKRLELGYEGRTLFPQQDETDLKIPLRFEVKEIVGLKDHFGKVQTKFIPTIIGFIEYQFTFGKPETHYTEFVFHLWQSGIPPAELPEIFIPIAIGSDVSNENLKAIPWTDGWGAD